VGRASPGHSPFGYDFLKFASTISYYKPSVRFSPHLHLRCSWGQRWTD